MKGQESVDAPTQQRLCELAAGSLGCKVTTGSLRQVMAECGIKTRRESQAAREKKALQEENDRLKQLLIKFATASNSPDWFFVRAENALEAFKLQWRPPDISDVEAVEIRRVRTADNATKAESN